MLINDILTTPKMYGKVSYKIYDKDHNLISMDTTSNNIVKGIRLPIIKLLASKTDTDKENLPFVKYVQLGTGTTTPTVNDTDLETPIPNSKKETFSTPQISTDGPSVTFSFLYDATDTAVDNKEIHEMGLYTTYNNQDVLLARTTVGTWKKVSGLYFEIYWTIGYQS